MEGTLCEQQQKNGEVVWMIVHLQRGIYKTKFNIKKVK